MMKILSYILVVVLIATTFALASGELDITSPAADAELTLNEGFWIEGKTSLDGASFLKVLANGVEFTTLVVEDLEWSGFVALTRPGAVEFEFVLVDSADKELATTNRSVTVVDLAASPEDAEAPAEEETPSAEEPVFGSGEITLAFPKVEDGKPYETTEPKVNIGGSVDTKHHIVVRVFNNAGEKPVAETELTSPGGKSPQTFELTGVPLELGSNELRLDVHSQDEGGWSRKPIGTTSLTVIRTEETPPPADSTTDADDTGTTGGEENDQAAMPFWHQTDTWVWVGAGWALLGLLGGYLLNRQKPPLDWIRWAEAALFGPFKLLALLDQPSKAELIEARKQEELTKRAAEVEVKVDQPAEPPPADEGEAPPPAPPPADSSQTNVG